MYDGMGTARMLVDAVPTQTDSYSLDAFGAEFAPPTGSTTNPYRGVYPERSRRGAAWGYTDHR